MKCKTVIFKDDTPKIKDFVLAIDDVPNDLDINRLRAYTDSSCEKTIPIDTSMFKECGVVYVKVNLEPLGSVYLEFNGKKGDKSTRNDVWSEYAEAHTGLSNE